jgi:hypothetical protein
LIEVSNSDYVGAEETRDLFDVARHRHGVGNWHRIRIHPAFRRLFHDVLQAILRVSAAHAEDASERVLAGAGFAPVEKACS